MTELDQLRQTRQNFIALLDGLTTEQLNAVPAGMNNNIIWNFAHSIVTQQLLCYKLAGKPMHISNELVEAYRKGTKPEGAVSTEEIEELKKLAMTTLDQFSAAVADGPFSEYTPYSTSFNVTLNSHHDAILFNNIHEGMHYGVALAQRRLV